MANNRKLGRATDHRMAMLRALVTYLLENGKVETTLARAKEVGPLTEKMITLGKKNTLASRRQAMAFVTKEAVVAKLFSEIAQMCIRDRCNPRIRLDCREELYRVRRQQGSSQEDWSDRCRALQG